MKKVILLGISAVLLTACSSTPTVKQLETHDGYLVECVFAGSEPNGVSCDWEHQVKK